MQKGTARRTGVSLAAVAVLAGAAGCQQASGKADGPGRGAERTPVQALNAAYQKTAAAKSAKVTMTMSVPAGLPDGGETKLSGVMGWDPLVMDVTMNESPLGGGSDGAEKSHMVWLDDTVYVDLGKPSEAFGGKRWGKFDLRAAASQSGDNALMRQVTAGLDDMNQDPAQQLAMLLGSPDVKHLGAGEVNGQRAEHYRGSLAVEEGLDSLKSVKRLTGEQREKLVANIKKAGVKSYDYDVWVNGQDYPVKMAVDVKTPQGTVKTTADYSDYGTKAAVQAPPAADTADVMEVLRDLMAQAG
ncbi:MULTISPECIES: hypothetical protein [unclassified Streptomyces]|uniref:hypothetical protein n=1 Tax=unclassified Streptomyces TaxID=2593676 RepID=UPI0005679E55|nr:MULTISPECIES: hypothetical protein [unclassified Streptomyces]MYT29230.1 hypothetical protein [Streptomyces sp. SID8354]